MSRRETIGPYRLLTPLASGGMAEVWLVQRVSDPPEATPLVLKTILPHYANSPDFVSLFLNETRVATQLQHPNIVRVYESGFVENCHFIAMEYVVGRTLRQILWRAIHLNNLFPAWFAVEVAAAICEALDYLHELRDAHGHALQLLHRDVTPENIMVSFSGEVKLLDFGIARALSLPSVTQAGTFRGKYAYMAPELVDPDRLTADVDCRSDLYSLGVVLYELLTGTRPYQADNDAQLLKSILDDKRTARPPSVIANWIPEALDRLVLKCIAKKPADRFQSARICGATLRDFMKDSGLCPTPQHVAEQVCGHPDSLAESSPPPSMRLQSPHEIAVKLDSGCHALRPQYDNSDWFRIHAGMRSEPVLAKALGKSETQPFAERRHDWDAAIRRSRAGDEPAGSGEMLALRVTPQIDETPPNPETANRQALELLDRSFELLRLNDVEAAISALKRAAQIEPGNRLVNANLRRLEQITTTSDGVRRRG